MSTAVATESITDTHAEDAAIIERLANLQQMHQQVNDLRSLLPNALLAPAREAIANPRQSDPQKVAVQISKAVQKGKSDIATFKRNWQDEKMRQLFKDVNAADLEQGLDSWVVNYQNLAKSIVDEKTPSSQTADVPFDTPEEVNTAIETLRNSDREIKVQQASDKDTFTMTAEVVKLAFTISRNQASNCYTVESISSYKLAPKLIPQIIQQISKAGPWRKIEKLLAQLEAYHDVFTRKCDRCYMLLDKDFDYATIRELRPGKLEESPEESWLAYHKISSCAS